MTAPLNAVTLRLSLDGPLDRTAYETEALAPTEVAASIAAWTTYAGRRGLSRDDTKGAIIDGLRNDQHREADGSYLLTCAALWLAGDDILRLEEPYTGTVKLADFEMEFGNNLASQLGNQTLNCPWTARL